VDLQLLAAPHAGLNKREVANVSDDRKDGNPTNGHESPELLAAYMLPEPQLIRWSAKRADQAKHRADIADTHVLAMHERMGAMLAEMSRTTAAVTKTQAVVEATLPEHRQNTRHVLVLRSDMKRVLKALGVPQDEDDKPTKPPIGHDEDMPRGKLGSFHDIEEMIHDLGEKLDEKTNPGEERRPTPSERAKAIAKQVLRDDQLERLQKAEDDAKDSRKQIKILVIAGILTTVILGALGAMWGIAKGTSDEHERHIHEVHENSEPAREAPVK
jgi:hypothetical protein